MRKTSLSLEFGVFVVLISIAAVIFYIRLKPRNFTPQYTSLHDAAVFDAEQIPQLFAAGKRLDGLDLNGNTPLWKAVRYHKLNAVRYLLELGADPNEDGGKAHAPLLVATFTGRTPESKLIVEQLIAAGADVNAISQQYDETALHYAVINKNYDVAELLINAGADVNSQSSKGDTPLQFAVASGNPDIADLLLKAGADPEMRNTIGFRPIDQLSACPNPEEVQAVFRSNGADDQRRPELITATQAKDEP